MNFIHRLFPAGHLVISLLFLLSGLILVVLAAAQLWQGMQLFDPASIRERLNAVLESIDAHARATAIASGRFTPLAS